MLTAAEITALQRRLARDRITHDMAHAMRAHADEHGLGRPADWAGAHHQTPSELMRMTATPSKQK